MSANEDAKKQLEKLYDERFRPINKEFKGVVTRWQIVRKPDGTYVDNTHHNKFYDNVVLRDLKKVHDDLTSFATEVSQLFPEMKDYMVKLNENLVRVVEWRLYDCFVNKSDSYHQVFWEMHSALLKRLGRKRDNLDEF